MKPQFLIAAPCSNSGKTTITLGLLRLLKNKGYHVQPFKCGPDYIDTQHHTLAAHTPSINLDTFMMSGDHVKNVYDKYSMPADITITEGVMGLFDGANKMQGSSAEIAMLLNLPVILVINAKAMAYSVAPLIYGFKHFDPLLKIAGVIFNFVNTESHYQFLKDACDDVGVEALGYVPANDSIRIPSRHLGLAISGENDYEKIIQLAAEHLETTVNINRLLEICSMGSTAVNTDKNVTVPAPLKKINISVAKDAAFNFMYQQNLEVLHQLGNVTYFSPMNDHSFPATDLLYLPGGYPELYAEGLATNHAMKTSIRAFCENGGKVIAECGGMMYLGKELVDAEGKNYSMVNFLDIETSMQHAKLSLGYRNIVINNRSLNGHEFHYSTCAERSAIASTGKVFNAKGIKVNSPIYRQKNVIASYIHFYWGENADLFDVLFN
jgi:cobyrinic acid a,c-diamide synthase